MNGSTPNGIDILKAIWNISDKSPGRQPLPEKVNTDIYNVPPTSRRIPHRPRPMP